MTTKLYTGATQYTPSNNLLTTLGDIHGFAAKSSYVTNDITVMEDSADSYNKKKCKVSNIMSAIAAFGANESFQLIGETAATDTMFSTTSTTYQNVVTLTATHTGGTFVIFFGGMPIVTNCDYRIWNSTDGIQTRYMPYDISCPCGFQSCGFDVFSLPSRSTTFILQFRSLTGGGLRYFRYAKLLLFQVR